MIEIKMTTIYVTGSEVASAIKTKTQGTGTKTPSDKKNVNKMTNIKNIRR